jgi:hypothetical protein
VQCTKPETVVLVKTKDAGETFIPWQHRRNTGRDLARMGAIFCPARMPRYASEYYELGSVPFRMLAMKRREFVFLIGSSAAWPLAARAQQTTRPVIGFLSISSPGPHAPFVAAFNQGLKELGFIEGQNLAIEYRWAEGHFDRLAALAADLSRRKVDVIAAVSGDVSIRAAMDANAAIPVVFITGSDPVQNGQVASFARPGGNVTGSV